MKRFLKKLALIPLMLLLVVCLITIVNYSLLMFSNSFNLNKNVNTLILGDSHTKYAFNDQLMINTYNFSQDADSYFYSYLKVKQISKENIQIDTVLLSFSQHNIHKCIEKNWLLNYEGITFYMSSVTKSKKHKAHLASKS